MSEKHETFIIDADSERRIRLKSATSSVANFGKTSLLSSLEEARRKLKEEEDERVDVVFASIEFGDEILSNFFHEAKEMKSSQDAAFIMVLPPKDQDSSTVARNVIAGADGILFEPYSVNQLVEITVLAAKVRKERSEKRERAAFQLILNDVAHQINLLAYMRALGQETSSGEKKLREMCRTIHGLGEASLQRYYSLLLERFADSAFPRTIYQKSYKGASKRVRDKMEAKLLAKLKQDMGGGSLH